MDLRDPATLTPLERSDHPLAQALDHGKEIARRELLVQINANRLIPVLVNVAVIRDVEGAPTGAVMLLQDITSLKELERLREEWLSIVGHDLRQPVATIRMVAELLRRTTAKEGTGERVVKSLDRLDSASTRLSRMINDLIDASRLEARHLELEITEFDLHEHLRAILGRLGDLFADRPVRISVPRDPIRVAADPDRIEQIVGNLLSNAVKYGDPGTEISLEIKAKGEIVTVAVTNVGHGIPADQLPHVFDRFERAWAPTQSRAPGIGLGLYICRGLVEAHGGRIWVASAPGGKTTFGFDLPLHRASTGPAAHPGTPPDTGIHA